MVADSFYLVWREGGNIPKIKHSTIESARKESRRLAQDFPQVEFFVCRAIEGVTYLENPFKVRCFKKQNEKESESNALSLPAYGYAKEYKIPDPF